MSHKTASRRVRVREYAIEPPPASEDGASRVEFFESELQWTDPAEATPIFAGPRRYNSTNQSSASPSSDSYISDWILAPWHRVMTIFRDLLLPIGYPNSVAHGYLEYQCYDSIQGLCSYLRSVLCSASVLQAAGVGAADATALSAAMTWALKDGAAMIGGLIFSYQASRVMDSHVKEFRFFADLINNVGLTLDMVAPYFKNHLLLVASAAGLCKTLCGLSAGATKSSLTQHFAIDGNMADVTAKESTQETFVSLLGMLLGVALAHHLQVLQEASSDDVIQRLQWIIFIALTILHIWSNYRGVALLRLRTLNRERAEQVLEKVVESIVECTMTKVSDSVNASVTAIHSIPSPNKVFESLLMSTYKMLRPGRLQLDAGLVDMVRSDPSILDEFRHERYVVSVGARGQVMVCLCVGATCQDQLKAFLHALVMLRWSASLSSDSRDGSGKKVSQQVHRYLNQLLQAKSTNELNLLMDELVAKGWDIEHRLHVGFSRRRFLLIEKDD